MLATVLVALGVLAVPAAWAADVGSTSTPATSSTSTGSSPYSAPGAPLADAPSHLRLEAVTGIANVAQRVQTMVSGHPLARWTATYDAATRQWVARLRDPKSTQDLAVVTVDDTNGKVVKVDLQEDLHPKARLTEKEARGYMERDDKVAGLGAAVPRRPPAHLVDAQVRQRHLDAVVVRERQGDRPRPPLGQDAQDPVVVDGAAGRVVDGPRAQVVVRQAHQRPAHLHPADGAVRRRPVRLAAAALGAQPRRADARELRPVPLLLQRRARSSGACRWRTRRYSGSSGASSGSASARAPDRATARAGRSGWWPGSRCSRWASGRASTCGARTSSTSATRASSAPIACWSRAARTGTCRRAPASRAARSTPTAPTPPTCRRTAPASPPWAAATRTAPSPTTRTCR